MARIIPKIMVTNYKGKSRFLEDCVSFVFERELYTPYPRLSAVFICDSQVKISDIKGVNFFMGDYNIFLGVPDKVSISFTNGVRTLSIVARGFTSMLGQNQPMPGIISNVNLTTLIGNNLPEVDIVCEENTPTENYIYVKAAGTLWDAVVAYSIKAVGRYPYIYGINRVMISRGKSVEKGYSQAEITSFGSTLSTSDIISQVFMKGTSDSYDYLENNAVATQFKIARRKYYDLDKQWLYDVNKGLKAKLAYSDRGVTGQWLEYIGFSDEQIFDKVTASGTDCDGKYISRVRIYGNSSGVFTKLWCYEDDYGQK